MQNDETRSDTVTNLADNLIRIGLDIGIESVGWAVMKCDKNGEPKRIVALGSRIFDAAEKPKDGGSLAADRREARSMRRRLRRKGERLRRLRILLKEYGVDDIEFIGEDANMLRIKGLDSALSDNEFARVLYLLCKNRGYSSTKIGEKNADDSKEKSLLQNVNANLERMKSKNYRTVGEMLYKEFVVGGENANGKWHNGNNEYTHTVYRDCIRAELEFLFEKQREFGNRLAASGIEEKYFEIFQSQRSYDIGPGRGSKYSAEYAVGYCAFEPEERRAPKASFSFEWSRALEKLNNVCIRSADGSSRSLTDEERAAAMDAIKRMDAFDYLKLRKLLGLGDDEVFNLSYPKVDFKNLEEKFTADLSEVEKQQKREKYVIKQQKNHEEKQKLSSLAHSNKIRAALNESHKGNTDLIDSLAEVLSYAKSEQKRREQLKGDGFECLTDEEIDEIVKISVDQFGMLSLKALRRIIPHLEKGMKYSDACAAEYGSHTLQANARTKFLNTDTIYKAFDDITSPVVKRAVSQTIKVLNAIIRRYGSPIAVNIELARDLTRSADERSKMEKQMQERGEANEKIKKNIIEEFGIVPSGIDIVKMRLYDEQQGKCVYSGAQIQLDRLFDGTSYQVDHVIPFSRSFNDSYNNKVLVLSAENQRKGNKLPYEYMSEEQFAEFENRVRTLYAGNRKKRDILLKKEFNNSTEWQSSALNDTRYISTMVKNLIENNLQFDMRALGKGMRVFTYNGAMTAYVRKQWGIEKVRSDGDLHHAVDAAVIACMTVGMRQRIERYNKYRELYRYSRAHIIDGEAFDPVTGESLENYKTLPKPYAGFREELVARTDADLDSMRQELKKLGYSDDEIEAVDVVYVSRMPKRKIRGKLHKETLYSAKYIDEGLIVGKTPLEKLKLGADGEIEGYFRPETDPVLYNMLKSMLQEAGGKGKEAFKDKAVYKPLKDGSQGPRVYSVKTYVKSTSGLRLPKSGAIAENDNMCRVDVYTKDKKFYLVPIYVSDAYAGRLPMKAIVAHKSEDQWKDMSEGYEFLFSLHKNDLIYIENMNKINLTKSIKDKKSKLPEKMTVSGCLAYFKGVDRNAGQISFDDVYGCYEGRVGAQGLLAFSKYEVDVLGDIHLVKKELRQPLKKPRG